MDNLFTQVNPRALEDAIRFIAGDEGLKNVLDLYRLLDQTELKGFTFGVENTMKAMGPVVQEANNSGLEQGYDDGYVAGVHDARVRPVIADAVVSDICEEALVSSNAAVRVSGMFGSVRFVSEEQSYDQKDALTLDGVFPLPFYEGDSGDEDPR